MAIMESVAMHDSSTIDAFGTGNKKNFVKIQEQRSVSFEWKQVKILRWFKFSGNILVLEK